MKLNEWGFNRQYMAGLWFICCCLVALPVMTVKAAETTANQIQNIDFHRDGKGRGVLTVQLKKSQSLIDLRRKGKQLQLDIIDAHLTNEQIHTLDVVDFATVVNSVDTSNALRGARFIFNMESAYDYDYYISGTRLEVMINKRIQPKKSATTKGKEAVSYKGQPISINFQDIPVRNVLQLIADYNDFNLVVADTVSGNVTLRLDNVPWPQVLDIILQAKGLDKRVRGSVLLVAPKSELTANEHEIMETQRKQQKLASLRSALIQINYAKATDISALLSGSIDGVGMLSERGSLHVDERTNSLIIKDTSENIASIKDIVSSLDIPVKQVQIEARIVTIKEGEMDELGVRWATSNANDSDRNSGDNVSGSLDGLFDNGNNGDKSGDGDGDSNNNSDFNVNLGVAGGASIAFQVAKIGNVLLDLELSALQTENKAEIISSPRLMTTNKKTAYIEQGTEIPYLEASSSGATSVSFKKAVLSLMVTPQITPDNKLVLDLEVTQDNKGEDVPTGTGTAISIDTQRIGTQVLVNNGETVVLGGIYQHSVSHVVRKVPVLGDIPVLGTLFRHKMEQMGKRELLIFVTPKIVMQ